MSSELIAELEKENKALREGNELLRSGCVTLGTAYMVTRLQRIEETLETLKPLLQRTVNLERRVEALDRLVESSGALSGEVCGLRADQERLTDRMDNAKEFLQVLKVKHGVDFELMPTSQEQEG